MHDGRFDSLDAVLAYYREPPDPALQTHERKPLALSDGQLTALRAFLLSLSPD